MKTMRGIVCFHKPEEINGYLSNWYPSDFAVDGISYTSMEQYMMYKKAIVFNDTNIAAQILQTSDVSKIKYLGRCVSGYNDTIWNGLRQITVYQGLLEKFGQNADLKERLLATGNGILAECAVSDTVWGNGISMKDPRRFDMTEWTGSNLLGFSLMMVRERFK